MWRQTIPNSSFRVRWMTGKCDFLRIFPSKAFPIWIRRRFCDEGKLPVWMSCYILLSGWLQSIFPEGWERTRHIHQLLVYGNGLADPVPLPLKEQPSFILPSGIPVIITLSRPLQNGGQVRILHCLHWRYSLAFSRSSLSAREESCKSDGGHHAQSVLVLPMA